jgi:hypothetical protein
MSPEWENVKISPWKYLGEDSRFQYRQGYKKAANLLADAIVANGSYIHFTFGMIFPALYLYRHYIEIEFKDLLALGRMFKFHSDHSAAKPDRLRHDLEKMLRATTRLSKYVQGEDAGAEFERTGQEAINFFVTVDPNGDGFKYPLTASGKTQWSDAFEVDLSLIGSAIARFDDLCHELRNELREMTDPGADVSDRTYFY